MKLRLILVLLLFVASAGILAWIYHAATRGPRTPKASPWAETITDLEACSSRKHVKAAQYDHFAELAARENNRRAERLFRAMAFSQRLQEQNCAAAIQRLGGSYSPPGKVVVFGGTTDDNLKRSIGYERQTFDQGRGAEIRRAMQKNNRYAARMLIWASAEDLQNIALMEGCRHHAGCEDDSCRYFVCPVCGTIYAAQYLDYYCPLCLTDREQFIAFE